LDNFSLTLCSCSIAHALCMREGDRLRLFSRYILQGRPKTEPLCFTAYNFRNIEQIFTKFGTNQTSKSLHCEHHAVIYLNQFWKWRHLANINDTSTTTSFELAIIFLHHFGQPACIVISLFQGIFKQNLSLHKRAPKARGSRRRRRRGGGAWGGVSPSQAD